MRVDVGMIASVAVAAVAWTASVGRHCVRKHGQEILNYFAPARRRGSGIVRSASFLEEMRKFRDNIRDIYTSTPYMVTEVKQQVGHMANATATVIQNTASATYETVGSSVTWIANLPWTMAAGVADFFTGVTDFFIATVQSIANFLMENVHYFAAAIFTTGVLLGVYWAINDALNKEPEQEGGQRCSSRVRKQTKQYNPATGLWV